MSLRGSVAIQGMEQAGMLYVAVVEVNEVAPIWSGETDIYDGSDLL